MNLLLKGKFSPAAANLAFWQPVWDVGGDDTMMIVYRYMVLMKWINIKSRVFLGVMFNCL